MAARTLSCPGQVLRVSAAVAIDAAESHLGWQRPDRARRRVCMTNVSTAAEASVERNGSAGLFDSNYRAAFIMVTALFFMWALPSNLNDILIRQFMKSFEMNRFRAGLVQSAFYLGYFVFS